MGKTADKPVKMKIRRGDRVRVIAGKDKGKEGKVLLVDRDRNRVIVEGVNMVSRHTKPNKSRSAQTGGIIAKEASLHASNVMYLHKGKPTRIGFSVTSAEQGGKKATAKTRIAKSTGEAID